MSTIIVPPNVKSEATEKRMVVSSAACGVEPLTEADFRELRDSPGKARILLGQDKNELRRLLDVIKAGNREPLPSERRDIDVLNYEIGRLEEIAENPALIAAEKREVAEAVPIGQSPGDYHARRGEHLRDERTGRAFPIWRAGQPIPKYHEFGEYDEPAEPGEASLAQFVRAVAGVRSSEWAKRNLSSGTDSAGGFLLPRLVWGTVLEALAPESSLLTAGAGIVEMDEGAHQVTIAGIDALPTAAWRAEGAAISESAPSFRGLVSIPRSLAFRFAVSRELLADAANLEPLLRRTIAQSLARAIDAAGLRGSGTPPEPRGIANVAGAHAILNSANGASLGTIRWSNLIAAVNAILAADGPMPTAAIMAPRTLTGFASLSDSSNQPLNRPGLLERVRFIATSQIPVNIVTGTSGDTTQMFVGDFSSVWFIWRERPSIQVAHETRAHSGLVEFIAHARLDVVVTRPSALAVVSGIRP